MSISELISVKDGLQLTQSLIESLLKSSQSGFIEDDDLSIADTPAEATDPNAYEKQLTSLQTYLNALPYKCEPVEYMQVKLEEIIEKLFICAKSKNWTVLTTWDGILQW